MRKRPLFARPPAVPKARRRFRLFSMLGVAIRRTCTAIGAMILLSAVIAGALSAFIRPEHIHPLPERMALVLRVQSGLAESRALPSFGNPFVAGAVTVPEIVAGIDAAAGDPRVEALVLSLEPGNYGLAHVQEIRAAIRRFQDSGKPVKAFASSFGDYGSALSRYYLAAAADEVWMQPVGMVSITGFNAEIPYFRGVLDRFGIRPEIFQREEYKTAFESVTHDGMTPASRRMTASMVGDLAGQAVGALARDRGIPVDVFRRLVDRGVLPDTEALEAGLIDRLDYGDVLIREMRAEGGNDDLSFIRFSAYAHRARQGGKDPSRAKRARAALIKVDGTIMPDDGGRPIGSGGPVVAAREIQEALLTAAKSDDYDVIVVRINSPGGSPTASETIRRGIVYAGERGKTVVVSMGPVAASGGYWIAAPADRIFALPATLTGSIGVVGGTFDLSELFSKIGVNWDAVRYGGNAEMWSFTEPLDQGARERFNAMTDAIYQSFLERVAEGRGMSPDAVRAIAGGRVWTGRQALENGLIDEYGGLDRALDYAARSLDLAGREDLEVEILPRPKTPFEQIVELLQYQVTSGARAAQGLEALEAMAGPLLDLEARARDPVSGLVRADMPDFQ